MDLYCRTINRCSIYCIFLCGSLKLSQNPSMLRSHSFPVKSVPLENVVFAPESRNLVTKAA